MIRRLLSRTTTSGRPLARFGMTLAVATMLAAFMAPIQAFAFTWTVSDSGDTGSTSCPANCQLRDAINKAFSGDSINFDPALAGQTITLTRGEIAIADKNLTITGIGANPLGVSGNNASRVFNITSSTALPTMTVSISGLTLSNGAASVDTSGGAVFISKPNSNASVLNVNLDRLVIQNSNAGIPANTTYSQGGGIYSQRAVLRITNSTISGNTAYGPSANGGGVLATGSYVNDSVASNGNTLVIINSTITGNSAIDAANGSVPTGGGVEFAFGTATILNSTIDNNTAVHAANLHNGNASTTGFPFTLKNSIVANGNGADSAGPNIGGPINDAEYALIDNDASVTYTGTKIAVTTGQNPTLGALGSNGGPTPTQVPASGSPAINAGNPAGCTDDAGAALTTDQRGSQRPDPSNRCDLGAYERFDLTLTPAVLPSAIAGVAYGATVGVAASSGALTYVVTSGSLAPFTLNAATGAISGTSNVAGSLNFTITATDQFKNTGSKTYALLVNGGPASKLVVDSFPSPTTAGAAHTVRVTAKDAFGNVANLYAGTVHLSSSDAAAALPADYTFVAGDNGVHTFSATLKTSGTQSITATDTVTSSITGTQTGIVVNAAAANTLVVSGYPSPVTAGTSGPVGVTAFDAYGNVATGYAGTLNFTSSDGAAVLPANSTLTNGAGTFNVTLTTAGMQSITATDTINASLTSSQGGIIVNAGAATGFTVSGYPSPVTAGTSGTFTVSARDAFGNVATGYAGNVHFSSSDGAAVLPANSALAGGVGTFSATLKTSGTQSITATDTVAGSVAGAQGGIVVNAGAATTFTVSGYPSPVTAGTSNSFSVVAKDVFGNTATGYAGTVHLGSTDAAAALPADGPLTNGVGLFSATLKTVGTQSVTATDTVSASITGTQGGIVVNAGAAATFTLSGYPSPITAGTSNSFTVTARDSSGNTATGYSGTVHFTSSDAAAVLPANTTLSNGVGTFSATLKTAGTQSISAIDTVTSSITGAQSGIVVNAGAAATFMVSGYPSPATAGTSNSFSVTARDSSGNTATGYTGTVHFTSSDVGAVLPADATLSSGVGTFSATLRTAGTQSISATDAVTASITGTQTIVVNAGAAATFVLNGYPSPATAGTSNSFTVTARDSSGNTATGYTGTVHFTSSDATAVLPADATLSSGVGTFSATLRTAGTQSISATDAVTASITGTQGGIVVNAGAAATFVLNGYPSPVTAGTSNSFTVTARDSSGNTATGYTGTVHFTSSDAAAVLPADAALSSGVGTFSATLKTAATQSISATDTVTASITGAQGGIVVNAGAAATFTVSAYPSPITAGTSNSFSVIAKDASGNTATGYTGTVHFASSDGAAVLPANSTLTNGVGTFSATLKTSGTQSITATDTVTASITGAQGGIVVNAGAAATFTVSGYPSPVTAGASNTFTVTARDSSGNTAKGYAGTVNFTSSDGAAVLPANSALTNGVGTFSATLKTAGTQSISATDTVTASITGSQAGIVVNAGAAATFTVSGYPSPVTAGASNSFSVTAKDSSGNTATGYTGTVHFTSSDGAAVLPANSTLTNGVGTLSATLKTTGTQSITATDTVTVSITGAQGGIVVNAGAATKFVVSGYPSPVTAGTSNSFSVIAKDAFGNTVTGYTGTAHLGSTDAAAVLPADSTLTNGIGLFSATLKTVGTQSITATDTVSASITGLQAGIVVNAGAATTFAVSAYPSPATAGSSHNFTVTARDSSGNTATGYTGTVHLTSTDAQAVLPADYAFTASDAGVHTFTATLKTAGTQSITATDTLGASITGTQTGIVVNAGAAVTVAVSGYPSPVTAGVSNTFTVTAKDSLGNVATAYTGTIHFSSGDAATALPADSTLTNGVGTFSATLKTAGTRSLTATDTVTASITGTQAGIVVNPGAAATFTVSGYPSPVNFGTSNTFSVTAKDGFGNTATAYAGTIHFTSSDGSAVLPADYGYVAGDSGVHAFNATLNTAGTQSITATDTLTGSITGAQTGIVVKPRYVVSASVNGGNGTISPATQSVDAGSPASLTLVPNAGYHALIDPATTCPGGSLSGGTYTTANITADCSVVATFAADAPPVLAITVSDNRTYARYGILLNYTVTVTNSGSGDATGVTLANTVPAQLDAANTTWICDSGGGGAICSATGSGALTDSGVVIPAGRSLTWLVTAPVLPNAIGATIDYSVSASRAGTSVGATDSDILVIFRDGFDVPYADGTASAVSPMTAFASCPADPVPETLNDTSMRVLTVPTALSETPVDTLLVARTGAVAGFRVERLNLGTTPRVRLVVIAQDGSEHASEWASTTAGAALAVATADAADGSHVLLLEGAASPLALPLPGGIPSTFLIQTQSASSGACL